MPGGPGRDVQILPPSVVLAMTVGLNADVPWTVPTATQSAALEA